MRGASASVKVHPAAPARIGPDHGDATVYLRRDGEGWSVSLGDEVRMFGGEEDRAFEHACALMYCGDGAARRMEILSGPSSSTILSGASTVTMSVMGWQAPPVRDLVVADD